VDVLESEGHADEWTGDRLEANGGIRMKAGNMGSDTKRLVQPRLFTNNARQAMALRESVTGSGSGTGTLAIPELKTSWY
jgi:hypothetical protein